VLCRSGSGRLTLENVPRWFLAARTSYKHHGHVKGQMTRQNTEQNAWRRWRAADEPRQTARPARPPVWPLNQPEWAAQARGSRLSRLCLDFESSWFPNRFLVCFRCGKLGERVLEMFPIGVSPSLYIYTRGSRSIEFLSIRSSKKTNLPTPINPLLLSQPFLLFGTSPDEFYWHPKWPC
jgi:hypothetical protein